MLRLIGFVFIALISILRAQSVEILYFTDAHRIYPVDDVAGGRGGVARLKTVADRAREANPDTLLIHGGDLCGGVLFGGVYKGVPMVEAFNEIPLDIANFGQHEFDFGAEHTLSLVRASKFQWITTNLKTETGEAFGKLPTILSKKLGGLDIVFIGLTDAMATTIVDADVVQEDLFDSVKTAISKLSHWDVLVALTQTSLDTNRKLLERFEEIDLILTEEQYEYESSVVYVGSRAIVAPAGNMSTVAKVSIDARKKTKLSIIPLDSSIDSDPQLLQIEQHYLKEIDALLAQEVGYTHEALDVRSGHQGECTGGNVVTDAFRAWYDSDVGLINSGSLRADIPAGKLTQKSVRSLLPFGNKVCLIQMNVGDLKQLLQEQIKQGSGHFPHVSGIRYVYSAATEVLELYRGKQLLDESTVLSIASSDYFISKITKHYSMLVDSDSPKSGVDYEVLSQFCQTQKELFPGIEGRIRLLK